MTHPTGIAARGTFASHPSPLQETEAWTLLLGLAAAASAGRPVDAEVSLDVEQGRLLVDAGGMPRVRAEPDSEQGFCALGTLEPQAQRMLEIFMPLCVGARSQRLVVGHLGQSLDGRVATVTGASQFITGAEDLRHTHRLRALFDAVLVGAQTVVADDPRLTTRLVEGPTPVRVVLDPRARLGPDFRVLRDSAAPTLLVVGRGAKVEGLAPHVRLLQCTLETDGFDLEELLELLRAQGLSRVFVEGGGVTVSRFLRARALDRLHLAVAPTILGSGAHALRLPPVEQLSDAVPLTCRRFSLGHDMLFDCDLRLPVSARAQ